MKNSEYKVQRIDADEGKVFDWANLEAHLETIYDDDGNETGEVKQNHLYAKIVFIGENDSIDNYVEIDDPRVE